MLISGWFDNAKQLLVKNAGREDSTVPDLKRLEEIFPLANAVSLGSKHLPRKPGIWRSFRMETNTCLAYAILASF